MSRYFGYLELNCIGTLSLIITEGLNLERDNKFVKSLIASSKKSSNTAFEQLYRLYCGKAYAASARLTANSKAAEDNTIRCFLTAWKNISFVREDTPFAGWITGIAVYTYLEQRAANPGAKNETPSKKDIPKFQPYNRLEESILLLPGTERCLIVLHYLEKYSLEESSGFLGITSDEAKNLIVDSIQKIAAVFDYLYDSDQVIDKIRALPSKIEAPETIWEHVVAEIRKEKNEKQEKIDRAMDEQILEQVQEEEKVVPEIKTKPKKLKKKKHSNIAFSLKLNDIFYLGPVQKLILATVVVAGLLFLLLSDSSEWEVKERSGSVFANQQPVPEGHSLFQGQTISGLEGSQFTLSIPDVGEVTGYGTAKFKKLAPLRLKLIRGHITVKKENGSELFTVDIPSAIIKDYVPGGSYDIRENSGSSIIHNSSGWISISSRGNTFLAAPGYYCGVDQDLGAGIPYSSSASDDVKKLISSFNLTSVNKEDIVDRLLIFAQNKDLISLWNILKICSPAKRGVIYDYMSKLIMMPANITREGIIYLDDKMMSDLRKELETALLIR